MLNATQQRQQRPPTLANYFFFLIKQKQKRNTTARFLPTKRTRQHPSKKEPEQHQNNWQKIKIICYLAHFKKYTF